MKKRTGLKSFYIIMAIFFMIVVGILIYPTVVMILSSFQHTSTGAFTLDNYIRIFSEYQYISGFKNSITLAIISSVIGLIITVLATYGIYSYMPRLKQFFLTLANLTANYVGVPLSFGLILLLGNAGILTNIAKVTNSDIFENFSVYSVGGLLLGFVYFQIPMGITLLLPIYDALDKKWREAAYILGATSLQYWLKIGFPVLFPSIIGVFAMMFANAIGTYDTAVALTGTSVNMIAINIANTIQGDIFALPEVGSAISVVLGIILFINMGLGQWLSKRSRRVV
ncbi:MULTISPECIES: ABC transporter permease [unclassified Jeotgalibaca]|uniref:ABC transporter permease n=1 Tax=unclassified Jeotgalibaca TaxID=2621505 RepID=UPI003FCF4E87